MSKIKTLDKFTDESFGEHSGGFNELQFTGNWFIDAGILGFVNLMEEVYDWDLGELRDKLGKDSEVVYYGCFPFAYLFYHSKVRGTFKQIREIREKINRLIENKNKRQSELAELEAKKKEIQKLTKSEIRKLEQKIEKINSKIIEIDGKIEKHYKEIKELTKKLKIEKNNLKNALTNTIEDVFKDSKNGFVNYKSKIENLILGFNLNLPQDHRDFFLYNPKRDLFTSFVYLYYLLRGDFSSLYQFASEVSTKKRSEGLTYEIYPDSTVNPFLYSPTEFSNIGYTNPLSTDKIKDGLKLGIPVYLLLLSFSNAFQPPIAGKRIMFYTNSLETSYNINKRIRIYREKIGENTSIFQITWMSILDELTESKAKFSLENMYLIEFEGIENQKLKGVEFIGIPKLQASIILDDAIRDALNKYIPTPKLERGRRVWIWALEEFIKNKPLLPHLINYLYESLSGRLNIRIGNRTLIHANSVDAQLKEFGKDNNLFSNEFLNGYRNILFEIKENTTNMFLAAKNVYSIFNDLDERKRMASRLLSTIRKRNKYAFTNILLKSFIGKAEKQKEIRNVNRYLFDKIVSNDINWENYALAIVIGLIYGGVESGESEESEE